jgi:hypothetical protein
MDARKPSGADDSSRCSCYSDSVVSAVAAERDSMRAALFGLAAGVLLASTPSSAAVTFTFSSFGAGGYSPTQFSFTRSTYITSNTIIPVAATTSCTFSTPAFLGSGPGVCDKISFFTEGLADVTNSFRIDGTFNGPGGLTPGSITANFSDPGVFSRNGTFFGSPLPNNQPNPILTVSGFAEVSAAPEPGTWAMMILGFGIVGYSLRRTHRQGLKATMAAA